MAHDVFGSTSIIRHHIYVYQILAFLILITKLHSSPLGKGKKKTEESVTFSALGVGGWGGAAVGDHTP